MLATNADKHIAYQNNEINGELIEFKNNKVLKYQSYVQYYDGCLVVQKIKKKL